MSTTTYNIVIVGAGRTGTAIGNLLYIKGHRITAAATEHEASLEKAAPYLPGAHLTIDLSEIARDAVRADIVLLTTQDDKIEAVCTELARYGAFSPHQMVIHMSGASALGVLAPAQAHGAAVASIHPIQSFASAELAIEKIPGSYFGVTADARAREVALALVGELGGIPLEIKDDDKTLYHAAACITSNYLVTLMHVAEEVYKAAGLQADVALDAMMPLITGTISNIARVGTTGALTGPIARGDVTIIEQHLQSLRQMSPHIERIYRVLGLETIDLALQKGTLSTEVAQRLCAVLEKDQVDVDEK